VADRLVQTQPSGKFDYPQDFADAMFSRVEAALR